MENVPCPFGVRPESSLYPPRLRRPSSLYGAGAAAASSRPPSRQVSVSPSVFDLESQSAQTDKHPTNLEYQQELDQEEVEEIEEDEEEENDDEIPSRYARPDSFTIPIGGVWRPGDEGEVRWGTIATETEYQTEEEGDGVDPVFCPPACSVSCADIQPSLRVKLTISP